jgi:hypothetical protein
MHGPRVVEGVSSIRLIRVTCAKLSVRIRTASPLCEHAGYFIKFVINVNPISAFQNVSIYRCRKTDLSALFLQQFSSHNNRLKLNSPKCLAATNDDRFRDASTVIGSM